MTPLTTTCAHAWAAVSDTRAWLSRRLTIALAALALLGGGITAPAARAQIGNTVIRQFSGVPSGACSNIQIAVNLLNGDLYDCLSGGWHLVSGAGGAGTFDLIGSGVNTSATMTLGTGGTLTFSGSGINNASAIRGVSITGTPGAGQIPISSSSTAAAWGDPIIQGTQAAGSTTIPNPLVSGGSDYGGTPTIRTWKVDSAGSGHITVDASVTLANLPQQPFLNVVDFSDVTAGTPARGDLINVPSTGKWTRLALGANGQYLFSNGTDSLWRTPLIGDIGAGTSSANYTLTGLNNIGNLNKTLIVGPGLNYTSIQSAISSSDCPARGCTIYVRPDITMDTTTITISKSILLKFDCATYLYTGTATPLFALTAAVEGIAIEGCNRGATDTASGTVIQMQSNLVTAVSAANAPHLHIRNIAFMGTGSGTATGLALSGTRIHISDALVSGFGGTGAIIDGTTVNSNVCIIEHSRFQNNLGSGLKLIGLNTDNCAIVSGDASNNTVDGYVIASPVFATTFFGTNADGNGSGIGYHFLSGSGNNAGYIFVDTGNNITFDAGTAGNNFVILNTGAVVDNGSGDRYSNATGNSIAWNALDAFAMNLSGNTSGKITLAATAIAGANTATFPANTGTVAELNLAQTWTAAQSHNAGTLLPTAAGGTDLGSTALPFGNLWLGTAATNNFKFQPAATAAARVISMPDPLGAVNMPYVIVSGTSAMTTAGIATGACGTTVTTAATGALTTDSIEVARNAAPTNANGGNLILNWWPTAGNVNFNYCNPSAGTVTPTAMTINWRVIR